MIRLLFYILFPFTGFAQVDKVIERSNFIFKGPIYSNQNPELVSDENREGYDSSGLIVIRGKYRTGNLHVEIVEDIRNEVYNWKQYYPNKLLKEVGNMTKDELIRYGNWTYFTESGKIDTTINYDSMLSIPYEKAIGIAGANGFIMPGLDVDLAIVDNDLHWQVRKWIMKNGDGISSTIYISTIDGEVSKATEEIEKHY